MESKKLVRCLLSGVEPRKEILNVAYDRGLGKGKKIEPWITTEMLAKLLEIKEKKVVDKAQGEHKYHIPKISANGAKRYPRCDLWWGQNDSEHWLEVKTLRFHNNTKGLKKDYKERIEKDLDRVEKIKPPPPYTFHHLLIVFDDKKYDNGNWLEDLYSLYNDHKMEKEDEWKIVLDERRTLKLFLHFKSK